jgi:hypothetical protein
MGCGKMKAGGPVKKVKKMAKGGATDYNYGIPLNGLPMRPTNGNTDISKNQMGTNPTMKKGGTMKKMQDGGIKTKNNTAIDNSNRQSNINLSEILKKQESLNKQINREAQIKNAAISDANKNQRKKGGSVKKMKSGGALKAVPSSNTGLSKLPTAVRNKMGYQKKGGSVKKK